MEHVFRIIDFNVYNAKDSSLESSDDEQNIYKDTNAFVIQMFEQMKVVKLIRLLQKGLSRSFM